MADFIDTLIENGKIGFEQLDEAKVLADRQEMDVGDALIHLGYASGEDVMRAKAAQFKLDYVDLRNKDILDSVVQLIPESVARENTIMPFSEMDGKILIAAPNRLDDETIKKLVFIVNKKIRVSLAPREEILSTLNRYYGQEEVDFSDSMMQEQTQTSIDMAFDMSDDEAGADGEVIDENSAPIVRLVQYMIDEAVKLRASDIHIEPFEDRVRVRYRIDGVLVQRDSPPRRLLGPILSRIKILASLDIAERRRPQDGRIKITAGEKELDLRVSVIPTNHGQSIVMRLLDKDNIKIGVKQLGLSAESYQKFQSLMRRPNGIILVTGPTGSGKTTTLYAALNELNRPDRKIITAEDPVEYYLPGINQVEVKASIGLDFARIIRAMLRQAPNVILVGEMRDTETAQMGIQASLTGHLVFSTLHTNDAPSAITRMVDMGVPNYLVASSVIAVLAQRLVRKVCLKCKQSYEPLDAELADAGITPEQAENGTFVRGKGCIQCQQSGYRGRIGIYELMLMTPEVREMAFAGKSSQDIRRLAITQGMSTLYKDGIHKTLNGTTTLEEVYRVAKRTQSDQ